MVGHPYPFSSELVFSILEYGDFLPFFLPIFAAGLKLKGKLFICTKEDIMKDSKFIL